VSLIFSSSKVKMLKRKKSYINSIACIEMMFK